MHIEIPAGQVIRIQFDDGRETSIAAVPTPVPAPVPESKRRSNVLVCSMFFGVGMFGAGMLYQGSRSQNTPQPTAEKIVPAPLAPQPTNPFGLKP